MNPKNTSQDCSNYGEKVEKELNIRTHSCPHCGVVIDRDWNAAINIKNRAAGHSVLKARACPTEYRGYETRSPHYTARLVWEYVTRLFSPLLKKSEGRRQKAG
ncbi:zinc ribbon domain-containing protein [Okeania sp. SIO1I7]|uniref:zinc ribbon domain-containing protein n=1 Tax=Okeania sp. SIO1I7 TaxID=2607772 RepID=UPI003453F51A